MKRPDEVQIKYLIANVDSANSMEIMANLQFRVLVACALFLI